MTEKVSNYKFWRLIGKTKQSLGCDLKEVKAIKIKELNCLQAINWHVDIEQCTLIEQSLVELLSEIVPEMALTAEETQFVRNTAKAIGECLHRPCKAAI